MKRVPLLFVSLAACVGLMFLTAYGNYMDAQWWGAPLCLAALFGSVGAGALAVSAIIAMVHDTFEAIK